MNPQTRINKLGHKRRAARYAQVAEQIRVCFKVSNDIFGQLRKAIKRLFDLRDQAIHPNGKLTPAELYPELDRGVEYRFVRFRTKNVAALVQDYINILDYITSKSKPKNTDLVNYAKVVSKELHDILEQYKDLFQFSKDYLTQ